MKVYIGKHVNWFGPYQLAEALCFWVKDEKDEFGIRRKPDWVHKFGEWLAHGSIEPETKVGETWSMSRNRPETFLYKFLSWVHSKKKRIHYIKIDKYDCWNIDATLSPIILPMLKQLRSNRMGSAYVDLDDVPEELRATTTEDYSDQKTFDFYHEDKVESFDYVSKRWDYVLDEMIFAFEHKIDDSWEDEFRSGEHDIVWRKREDGCSEMEHGPNDTYKCDYEGIAKVNERIQNGFRLFGKYYQNLWD